MSTTIINPDESSFRESEYQFTEKENQFLSNTVDILMDPRKETPIEVMEKFPENLAKFLSKFSEKQREEAIDMLAIDIKAKQNEFNRGLLTVNEFTEYSYRLLIRMNDGQKIELNIPEVVNELTNLQEDLDTFLKGLSPLDENAFIGDNWYQRIVDSEKFDPFTSYLAYIQQLRCRAGIISPKEIYSQMREKFINEVANPSDDYINSLLAEQTDFAQKYGADEADYNYSHIIKILKSRQVH